MQKRDFIQQASIQFIPSLNWDFDKSIAYAEQLWRRLGEKGYGETKPSGDRELIKAYDKLSKNPILKTGFDLFWTAFGKYGNRDRAALSWIKLDIMDKSEIDKIVSAAKREAANRKNLPENRTAVFAERWLNERRWLDSEPTETETETKKQNQRHLEYLQTNQDLAHAKRMAEQTGDPYWQSETQKLTERLRQLRSEYGE